MSFALALDIGHFDRKTFGLTRPLDAAAVQQAIMQAGGRLPDDEHPDVVKRRRLMDGFAANGRPILGIIGRDFVILHEGYLMLAVRGSSPSLLTFLRLMVADDCTIWRTDGGEEETESILEWYAADLERRAASYSQAE
jgi:hypothetical protein